MVGGIGSLRSRCGIPPGSDPSRANQCWARLIRRQRLRTAQVIAVAPPADLLFTFDGQPAGPSANGWHLQGLAWPDPAGTEQIDGVLLVAGWFRRHPEERRRTFPPLRPRLDSFSPSSYIPTEVHDDPNPIPD